MTKSAGASGVARARMILKITLNPLTDCHCHCRAIDTKTTTEERKKKNDGFVICAIRDSGSLERVEEKQNDAIESSQAELK